MVIIYKQLQLKNAFAAKFLFFYKNYKQFL